ncbi:MAG: hypothetical protein A4S09_13810 [Proteobacteria bacterium SG_bin7]|nr:MAG: hypothetical protein A4S09_13810 [Proteobacteria bacterium SG_bin7]
MKNLSRRSFVVFSLFLIRSCRFFWSRFRLTLCLVLALTFIAITYSSKLKFIFSADDMIGEGIPSAEELRDLKVRYDEGIASILFIQPSGKSFSPQELCHLRKWYSVMRATYPFLKSTLSTFDAKDIQPSGASSVSYKNILHLRCEDEAIAYDLQSVKSRLENSPYVFFKDKKDHLSILMGFTFAEMNSEKFGSFDPRMLNHLRLAVDRDLKPLLEGAKFSWVGPADYQWYVLEGFRFSSILNLTMIFFLFFSLRFVYGTWIAGTIYCCTFIFGTLVLIGLKGFLGSPFDVLSTGLILLLGISSLEDFTFICSEQMKGVKWKSAIKRMILPSFFTSLTTIVGFLSLYVSDLAVIKRLGFWAAFGAALEWFLMFSFMPVFLIRFYKENMWVDPKRAWGYHFLDRWGIKSLPRRLSLISLIVFPIGLYSFSHLNVNDNPYQMFPRKNEFSLGVQEFLNSKGWVSNVSLVLTRPEALSQLEKYIGDLNRDESVKNNIIAVESPERVMNWLDKDHLIPKELTQSDYKTSSLYKRTVDENGIARALIFIKDTTVDSLIKLKKAAENICPNRECYFAGELIAYADFSAIVPKTLLDSMMASLFLVAIVIYYLAKVFYKQHLIFPLLATAFWGPFLTIGMLATLSIQMDFMKCVVASVLVGLAGDNAIQYIFAARRHDLREGIERRGGASVITNVLMTLTAFIYLGSYFSPPKGFGLILAFGLITSLIGDLWLLNGLLQGRLKK